MSSTDFERFFAERGAAAEAHVNGNPAPLDAVVTKEGDATYHSPR
jgi:hypothetical protein